MVRTTFRWLMILLGFVGAAGGATAWYAWVRSDAMVRDELHKRLAQIAPACDLQIGKVRFDWDRSITVRDFAVRAKGKDAPPTLVVPEVVISIDHDRFVKDQAIDVRMVKLIRPRFDLTRRVDGTWSVEDLAPFHLDPSIPVPEWQIEDASVRVRLEQENAEPVVLALQEAKLRLVPAGRRQLVIRGLSDVADAGPLKVSGTLNLEADRMTWSLSGSVAGLNTSGNIAGFALRSSANLRKQVAELGRKLEQAENALVAEEPDLGGTSDPPFRVASRDGASPAPWEANQGPVREPAVSANGAARRPSNVEPSDLTGLGVNAVVDIDFSVGKPDPARPPSYQVTLNCRDGKVVNPLLPFALSHLRGQLYWDNDSLRVTEMRAEGDGTSLRVDAGFRLGTPEPSGSVTVAVSNLAVSDRYPGKLPPPIERFLQIVHPSGPVDLDGTFERDEAGTWATRAFKLTAKGATAVPEPFPYPIQEITGVLEQTSPGRLEARMTGKAGVRPVALYAVVENPGPEAEVGVEVTAASIVVDEAVREAFRPEVRTVLDRLGLEGTAEELTFKLFRPAGPFQKYGWWLKTTIRNGEIEYRDFPYRVKQLTGQLDYNSETETLTLSRVQGVHDRAVIGLERGTYRKPPATPSSPMPETAPFGLDLPIVAKRVNLGGDLRAALMPSLRSLWDDLQPGGTAELAVHVRWVPGGEPDIRLPEMKIVNGSLRMKAFPYPLDSVAATLSYDPGRLGIADFVGWHDVTSVAARDGSFQTGPDGEWLLSLPTAEVSALELDADLLRAVPAGLREAIEALGLRGSDGRSPLKKLTGHIDVRGSRRSPVATAGWDLTAELSDAAAKAGVDVSHAFGLVKCEGRFDGAAATLTGNVALGSAEVFGQRLTNVRGPFAMRNRQIEIGTRDALAVGPEAVNDPPGISTDRRLRAVCLGDGILTLDALVNLGDGPRYQGRSTLTGASLENFARRGGSGPMGDISGTMNGWVNFRGVGSSPAELEGRGRMRVAPAALYQLPVFMQLFQSLTTIAPPGALDNTAFQSAEADFRIRDRRFEAFLPDGRIVLAGNAMRLAGGGYVDFDGNLRLELYTTLAQNPVRAVPVVGRLVGGILDAATTGWFSVVVSGTTDAPRVDTVPLKAPVDGVRQILESLGPPPARTAGPLPGSRR